MFCVAGDCPPAGGRRKPVQTRCWASGMGAEVDAGMGWSSTGGCRAFMPAMQLQVTAGGILLAGDSRDVMADALLGEVLAVGAEVDVGVAKGDAVVFSKYSSSDVKLPAGGEVCFVAQKSILATLSK